MDFGVRVKMFFFNFWLKYMEDKPDIVLPLPNEG